MSLKNAKVSEGGEGAKGRTAKARRRSPGPLVNSSAMFEKGLEDCRENGLRSLGASVSCEERMMTDCRAREMAEAQKPKSWFRAKICAPMIGDTT